jgi:hypothetical protein
VRTPPWRIIVPALLLIGYAAHVCWRLWLLRYVPIVVAHADEDRYLLIARSLAGGPGGFGNDTEAFRRLGYPLILTPIYSFTEDPFRAHNLAQMIGAFINALAFPLAYLFARRVLNTGRWLSLGMALVAAVLPAVVYYSQFVLTDVMFAPIGLAWLLLIHGWLAGRTSGSRLAAAIGAGLVVGFAYVVHVRGTVMLGVHLGLVLLIIVSKRGRRMWAMLSAAAAIAATIVDWIAKQSLGTTMVHGGQEPNNQMLQALTDAAHFVRTLTDATGQLWYLAVATGGLGAVGLVVAWRAVRSPGDFVRRTMLGTVLVTTVLISLSSASALQLDSRVSNHAYFRYIAFLAPVWVMVAIAALAEATLREKVRLIGTAMGVIGVTLFVVLARISSNEWFHPFDTPEASAMTNSWEQFRPFKATVVAVALLALWLLRQRFIPLMAVVVVSAAAMVSINVNAIQPMTQLEYLPGSRLVQDLGVTPNDVVQVAEQVDMGSELNFQREVYWQRLTDFDALTGRPDSATTVVIAPWFPFPTEDQDDVVHWDGTSLGWQRVYTYMNEERQWALWRRSSGAVMSSLDRTIAKAR